MHAHTQYTHISLGLPCKCTHALLCKRGCTCRTLHAYTHISVQTHCCTHAMPYTHASMSTHHTRHVNTNTATQTHPTACTVNTHTHTQYACTHTLLHTSPQSHTCMTVHHSCTHPHGTPHHGPQHHTTHEAGTQAHPLPHTQETLAHTNRDCRHVVTACTHSHRHSRGQARCAHVTRTCTHKHSALLPPVSVGHPQRTQGSSWNLQQWWVQPGCPPSLLCVLWVLSPAHQPHSPHLRPSGGQTGRYKPTPT